MCCIGLTFKRMEEHWLFSPVHSCNSDVELENSLLNSYSRGDLFVCSHPNEQDTAEVTCYQYLIIVLEIWPELCFSFLLQAISSYPDFIHSMVL